MQRCELGDESVAAAIVIRTCVAGAATRPLKSKVIALGAPVSTVDVDNALRLLMFSVPEATVHPAAQKLPRGARVTLALRLTASLRASSRSAVMSRASALTF